MITYLAHGWMTATKPPKLREEVVDGAIEAAGMLFSAGLSPQTVGALGVKLRALMAIADPHHRRMAQAAAPDFSTAERQAIAQKLRSATDGAPPLQSFVLDCLDHVPNAGALGPLYLHVMHITHMMQLLQIARVDEVHDDAEAHAGHAEWLPEPAQVRADVLREATRLSREAQAAPEAPHPKSER